MIQPGMSVNPMLAFNKPALPGQQPDQQAISQLLMLLGGLGGPVKNPLVPGAGQNIQPGPPTNATANIIGGLGAG
jgi:hypothetical protein